MFSALLKELRAQNGFTQTQLAKAVGVSPGNVGDWETGKSKPGYNALASLSRIFEVSADYLLELSPALEKQSDDLSQFKAEQGLTCDGSPISDEEGDLIAMYRLLPEEQQEDIFDVIHLKYRKHVERKKESIYWTYAADREEKSDPSGAGSAQDGTA
ncbi:helix-turn-helix domain-containing protein [Intestinimonas butyriciproducens]|jgi:transcriptional regulator with XRE-family HTH domain|uniref:helix-turn-helix domain-containing protein n=1 Tax=Intestinimonas butyriciproducens TaxID=1297617 RepID=UPI0034A27FE3